jgi:hypothetical protein
MYKEQVYKRQGSEYVFKFRSQPQFMQGTTFFLKLNLKSELVTSVIGTELYIPVRFGD